MRYSSSERIENFEAYVKEKIILYNEKRGVYHYHFILSKCDSSILDIIVYSANHMSNTEVFHAAVTQISGGIEINGQILNGDLLLSKTIGKKSNDFLEKIAIGLLIYFIIYGLPYLVVYVIERLLGFNNFVIPLAVPLIILLIMIYRSKINKHEKVNLHENLDKFMIEFMGFNKHND